MKRYRVNSIKSVYTNRVIKRVFDSIEADHNFPVIVRGTGKFGDSGKETVWFPNGDILNLQYLNYVEL